MRGESVEEMTPTRPVLATVVAIIGIIFGLIGMCSQPVVLSTYFMEPMGNPMLVMIQENQSLLLVLVSMGILGFLLTIVEVIGCVGLLLMKSWARSLVLFYAAANILVILLATGVNFVVFLPVLSDGSDPIMVGGAVGGICGGFVSMVVPVAFILALSRPEIVEAYASEH